jgi:2-polyprenyl-3-methyl-5-hydroxy-6-metoxy-1,4-benzoquinol methylase
VFQTGDRRSEFERLYLVEEDPWRYRTSEEEHAKYQRTLSKLLQWAPGRENCLEVGCSIGVFTAQLGRKFHRVTSIDISSAALRTAGTVNSESTNINFVELDLRSLALPDRFDAIVCSEVLYYISEPFVDSVLNRLEIHLLPEGVLVIVNEFPEGPSDRFHFKGWTALLDREWVLRDRVVVQEASRPYQVSVFSKRDFRSPAEP